MGTPASASSRVEVPDLVSAARARAEGGMFFVRLGHDARRHAPVARPPPRTVSASRGTAGTTTSSAPIRSATRPPRRRISPPCAGSRRCGCPAAPAAAADRPGAGALPRHSGAARATCSTERMADEGGGRPAQPLHGGGLERQQRQHMIDIGAHGARAPRPPGPDRRADIVDDRDLRARARARGARRDG